MLTNDNVVTLANYVNSLRKEIVTPMGVPERIKSAREDRGLSANALARALGVTVKTVYRWESGESEPRMSAMSALASALGVRRNWLQTGKGAKPDPNAAEIARISNGTGPPKHTSQPEGYVPIFIVRLRHRETEAGYDVDLQKLPKADLFVEESAFLARYHDDPATTYYVEMVGESMIPTILPGERILMRPCDNEPIVQGALYLMSGRYGVRMSRIRFENDDLVLYCDNPNFGESRYHIEHFENLFTLHAVARSFEKRL